VDASSLSVGARIEVTYDAEDPTIAVPFRVAPDDARLWLRLRRGLLLWGLAVLLLATAGWIWYRRVWRESPEGGAG
jgi:hypothetical protein